MTLQPEATAQPRGAMVEALAERVRALGVSITHLDELLRRVPTSYEPNVEEHVLLLQLASDADRAMDVLLDVRRLTRRSERGA